jgi:hypothetical protein
MRSIRSGSVPLKKVIQTDVSMRTSADMPSFLPFVRKLQLAGRQEDSFDLLLPYQFSETCNDRLSLCPALGY